MKVDERNDRLAIILVPPVKNDCSVLDLKGRILYPDRLLFDRDVQRVSIALPVDDPLVFTHRRRKSSVLRPRLCPSGEERVDGRPLPWDRLLPFQGVPSDSAARHGQVT